jgi:hypothetical protein
MPDGRWVRRLAVGLGLALAAGPAASRPAHAQNAPRRSQTGSSARLIYYKSRAFRIPVTVPEEVRGLVREVRLYVSDDYGRGWREAGTTAPERPEFPFRATRDGEYWFAIQTVDTQGRVYPSDDRPVEPSLRVVVDTAPPTLVLEKDGRRGTRVAVRWEAQDENLVLRSLILEFQPEGAGPDDWRTVPLRDPDFRMSGAKTWDAGTAEPLVVRASVQDRARNTRSVEVVFDDGRADAPGPAAGLDRGGYGAPPPVAPISSRTMAREESFADEDDPFASVKDAATRALPPGFGGPEAEAGDFGEPAGMGGRGRMQGPARREQTLLAGSPRFPLQYEVDGAGPAGVARVQLWVTHDGGRTWYPQPEDPDRTSPYPVDVGGEGTYGLCLAVQGASGLGDPPPAPGDRPQMWVEVDATPPVVELQPPRPGTGPSAGKVLITWRASDPHLGARPVTLSYRADDDSGAGWTRLAGPLENTGQYVWVVPPGVPPKFRVRIEVEDALGHRGAAESGPVLVDRARPKGRIIGLDPSARALGDGVRR